MTAITDIGYTDEMFSGEQITAALNTLSDDDRYADAAVLTPGAYDADAIEAFAKLARTLKGHVRIGHYRGLVILRELPLETRRDNAIQALRRQAERGEIEPAYLHGRD